MAGVPAGLPAGVRLSDHISLGVIAGAVPLARVRKILAEKPSLYDPRKYLGPAREAMKEVVKQKMRLFGSSGKA